MSPADCKQLGLLINKRPITDPASLACGKVKGLGFSVCSGLAGECWPWSRLLDPHMTNAPTDTKRSKERQCLCHEQQLSHVTAMVCTAFCNGDVQPHDRELNARWIIQGRVVALLCQKPCMSAKVNLTTAGVRRMLH